MRAFIAFLLITLSAVAWAVDPTTNPDPTCNVSVPPPDAGEGGVHAQLYKVYPRKAALIGLANGCQNVWLYAAGNAGANGAQVDFMRLYFDHGRVIAARINDGVCRYSSTGLPNAVNGSTCPRTAPEAMPSQPAGCVMQPQLRVDQSCDDDG